MPKESTKSRTSAINTWKPKEHQIIVERDGKLFVCHFDRLLGHSERLNVYNRFLIGKESYINQLDTITAYTNFFINNYDFENELVMAYLKIKFALDKRKLFNTETMNSYIDFIYEVMFTDTMIEKIKRMVEDNYLDDIETNTEEKKKYLKNEKKHLESLEFTNLHMKILLQISFGMKIMSPALFHYIQLNTIKIEKDSDIIFRFYRKLFDIFGYIDTYEKCLIDGTLEEEGLSKDFVMNEIFDRNLTPVEKGSDVFYYFKDEDGIEHYYTRTKINMYNKLYVYVKAKVLESNASNAPIFSQREIFGTDVFTVVNQFTKKVLISENVVKHNLITINLFNCGKITQL